MARSGTPRTIEELREVYADADEETRARVERLWRAVEHAESKGMKASHVEENATSRGHLSHVFAGRRRNLDVSTLEEYARATGVNTAWLIWGGGPMVGDAPTRSVEYAERYPSRDAGALILREEAARLGLRRELVEKAIAEGSGAVHDRAEPTTALGWFEHFKAIANGIAYAERHPAEEAKRREADAARAREMEEATRPRLPKKKR